MTNYDARNYARTRTRARWREITTPPQKSGYFFQSGLFHVKVQFLAYDLTMYITNEYINFNDV